jgi:hypothetical protein
MEWARIPVYITGTVDQQLLLRNEYLVAENRILKAQLHGRLLPITRTSNGCNKWPETRPWRDVTPFDTVAILLAGLSFAEWYLGVATMGVVVTVEVVEIKNFLFGWNAKRVRTNA